MIEFAKQQKEHCGCVHNALRYLILFAETDNTGADECGILVLVGGIDDLVDFLFGVGVIPYLTKDEDGFSTIGISLVDSIGVPSADVALMTVVVLWHRSAVTAVPR